MGIFDFFRSKRRLKKRKRTKKYKSRFSPKQQIDIIKTQLNTINMVLQKHDQDIGENTAIIREHCQKLKTLEQLLATPSVINQPAGQTKQLGRLVSSTKPIQSNRDNHGKFDIDKFSTQEKRILTVFFNHKDMALSYRDIASTLSKAPNTIKNQIHQILLKADIFEKCKDTSQVNRFRLKDGLKIEKYLTSPAD
jgi:DNA-binding NarL/FixJ family response regulator